MTTATAPTKPPAPKTAPPPANAANQTTSNAKIRSQRGVMRQGERIGIYGPGGIGKTELVASLSNVGIEPWFIDLDCGTFGLDVSRAMAGDELVSSFEDVRAALQNKEAVMDHDAVVIDTFTTLEERIRDWVIANVPHEKKGKAIHRIEDYGFGKGLVHIFETALLILQDLDAISRMGKKVIIVCHQCAERVPSAETEDFLEYQPRLQSPPRAGKLRERVFEWCSYFFRIDHDRVVEDGKTESGDVRSIHTTRTTTAWAKHRTLPNGRELDDVIPFEKGSYALWETMFGD